MPYTCPDCGYYSAHPDDERYGYCDRCKAFTRKAPAKASRSGRARRPRVDDRRRPGPVDESDVARAPDVDDV